MDVIVKYKGEYFHGEKGHEMILKCTSLANDVIEFSVPTAVEVQSNGKPFFPDSSLQFSLSHSENIWACAFSEAVCGLDIQYRKAMDYMKIGRRFFKEKEIRCLEAASGEELKKEFYRIWTRLEAFGKCTGGGLFGERPDFADVKGFLLDCVIWKGEEYSFRELSLEEDFSCTFCRRGSGDGVRIMNITDKAFALAVKKLSVRPRTEWEMKKYLEGEGFDVAVAKEVLIELKELRYLDDEEYCRMFLRHQLDRGRGKSVAARKLKELGVNEFTVEDVFSEPEFDVDEKSLAREEAQKVLRMAGEVPPCSEKTVGRVARRLQSKGYRADIIYGIIGELRK